MRRLPLRSKRFSSKTADPFCGISRHSGTSIPASAASVSASASQRTMSIESSCLGNFAIARPPWVSSTEALGRAPPSDEPGASRSASASSSSVSSRWAAASRRGSSISGGTASSLDPAQERTTGLSRESKCALACEVVDTQKVVEFGQGCGGRFSSRAARRSARAIRALPQRSGAESPSAPNSARPVGV